MEIPRPHRFRLGSTKRCARENSSQACSCFFAHSAQDLPGGRSLSDGDATGNIRARRPLIDTQSCQTRILGTGRALPNGVITNDDLTHGDRVASDWIERLTGVRERRTLEPTLATSDLAVEAGRAACDSAGIDARQLNCIV